MSIRTKVNKVYETILAELSTGQRLDYVKHLGRGGYGNKNMGVRMVYPFVLLAEVEEIVQGATIGTQGRDFHDLTVKIAFGTQNQVPELAYYGSAETEGILKLADDLIWICRGNTFDGAFTQPAEVQRTIFDYASVASGWLWMGQITVVGRTLERRRQP